MAKNEENEAPDFDDPPRAPHSDHADRLMEHAEAMLEEGDRLQASEKAWGAYVHQMKALAEEKGWPYHSTWDLDSLNAKVAKLAYEELGEKEGEVLDMANAADTLHNNFYGDVKAIPVIRRNMERTKDLIDILRRLGGNGTASVGKPSRTPQLSDEMKRAEKPKKQFEEEPSVPLLTKDNFAFMTQAEFDALQDF